MKPTLSTSWRLRRRQSAISANAKSTAAAMLTDSMDGCIRFLSFALCGDDPQPPHPQREVPDMRPFLFVASVALIALTPACNAPSSRATAQERSAERRVGKECVSPCRYRWPPNHYKEKPINNML